MKAVEYLTGTNANPLPRRDLVAILAYLNRARSRVRCVDGTFACHNAQLDRLAAAARMQ
jgi:hypothetical protein